jgi:DNA-binding transcriptional LysR family regulator
MIALVPKLARLARDYPEVVLDVTTDNSRVDLVAAGFDAGIEIGEFIQKDMVAVRVSEDLRAAIVGSPQYFASHPKPRHPRDLLNHACINFRQGSRGMYRWEFDKGKQSLTVVVDGPLIVDDAEIQVRAALDGVGVVWTLEHYAAPFISAGKLVRVLEGWCAPFPGYFLYYPSRRQQPAALSALIKTLRLQK